MHTIMSTIMSSFFCLVVVCLLSISLCCNALSSSSKVDFYSLSATDISGNEIKFESYKGKIVLIVNVASECGYTDYNYEQLNELQDKYGTEKLVILGFPCNQFGFQEPGENSYIKTLVLSKYKNTFPLFAKQDVTGPNQSNIYKYLFEVSGGKTPGWNFCKYLINSNGVFVNFFSQTDSFEDIYKAINHLLFLNEIDARRSEGEL